MCENMGLGNLKMYKMGLFCTVSTAWFNKQSWTRVIMVAVG